MKKGILFDVKYKEKNCGVLNITSGNMIPRLLLVDYDTDIIFEVFASECKYNDNKKTKAEI